MKNGPYQMGFVTGEADGVITLRNIAGQVTKIKRDDVKEEKHLPQSMMPAGLAAGVRRGGQLPAAQRLPQARRRPRVAVPPRGRGMPDADPAAAYPSRFLTVRMNTRAPIPIRSSGKS